ncbi:carboxylesterase family protein [Microbacterium resistens]|uniref:carboxylesterase/lipase family protein n=1 Tax=Microbacterium resistens TaxID=156977 RepID=UPI001C59336E|nr:carboxylesterase family protein [Microbacterium resistens]MBW1638095.1 carboxylesterase family protein [Microbacterium resistens]
MIDEPTVRTTAGTVRGEWVDGAARFLGIPYAEPPFGELRFQSPVPRRPWDGVLEARQYGPTPQRKALAEITTIPEPSIPGEDTLTVNVFTPRPGDSDAGLPVLVWIHGGGYVAGSPASPWYDGRSFSRDRVVTVTVGYRLGFDGFGWLPDAPQNRGVRDWVLALEWVRDNISQFGGDPSRVTIAGQSAGGGAIMTLLTLPAAEGLFAQAVSVSGVPADVSVDDARSKSEEIAERLGVPLTAAALSAVPETELIAAQGFGFEGGDLSDPVAVLTAMRGMNGRLGLGPVVDGEYVVDTVENGMAAGRGSGVPLIVGATHDEFGGAFTAIQEGVDALPVGEALRHVGVADALIEDYIASQPGRSTSQVAAQFITDVMFRARIIEWLHLRADAPTWAYDFTWRSAVSGLAEHCVDVPFIFDVLDAEGVARVLGDEPPAALAESVHGAWVRFLTSGDPGWSSEEITILDVTASTEDTFAGARVIASSVPA